jgi:phage replication O-like protein O
MASPQLENGYTRIANEILEALSRSGLGGSLLRIILYVLRMTYGFQKKGDWISINQIAGATGLSRRAVIYGIQNLEAKNMITVERNSGHGNWNEINYISFQKNHEEWSPQDISAQYGAALKKQRDTYQESKARVVQETNGSAKKSRNLVQEPAEEPSIFAPRKEIKKKSKNKSVRKTCLPEDYSLSEQHIAYALAKGVRETEIPDLFEDFVLYHRKKGSRFVDWSAAWATWTRNHLRWRLEKDEEGRHLEDAFRNVREKYEKLGGVVR